MSKTALLFAGQGAQMVGMGRDMANHFPTARELVTRARAVLGYDLGSVCFTGPESELTKTEHAQPGIYLVGWMAFALLRESVPGLEFQATAGLSLGEFTALAAAGVLRFEEGLRVVRQRGLFMQAACDASAGAMAAVIGLDEAPLREVCAQAGVEVANVNCPGQIVISGPADRMEQACDRAREAGARKAVTLPVAGAYHSRLMTPARARLEEVLRDLPFREPKVTVLSNVTGMPHGTANEIRARLVEQVTAPVRWQDGIRYLLREGFRRFIELGPGQALSGFMKRLDRSAEVMQVSDVASLEATRRALGA